MSHSRSMHLPGELRDETLRALADVIGFDFWALDEVAKEDAARAIVEALDLEISDDYLKLSKERLQDEIKDLKEEVASTGEALANAEEALVELREFREDACAMFGVRLRNEALELDRPIGDLLDDLSDARQRLEDNAEAWVDAYWDLRCSTYRALGLDATRNEKATLEAARESEAPLGERSSRATVDGLVASMDLMDVAEAVGLLRSATGADVARAVRDLVERGRALEARAENQQSSETADVLAEVLDERARLIEALGLDPSATLKRALERVEDLIARAERSMSSEAIDVLEAHKIINALGLPRFATWADVVQAVNNLVEKHETLLSTYKAKLEGSGPLRGVL